ncbi:MAG TPA: PglZ domain-containing protein [Bacteroidales bacterium]|nr:PglZ domain-containing protein [Bacteroidales bacterium]
MIDAWFNKDLEKIYVVHQIAVFIDESKDGEFLLGTIKKEYQLIKSETEFEELKARYEIEKNRGKGTNYLIYTTTPKDNLRYIREYCETDGCIEIRYLQNYVKEKVHKHLNLNLHLEKEELISAAKVSIGKDQTYWLDLSHKGASEIFDLEKELLPFLDDPKNYLRKYDKKVQEIFFKKVNELIDQAYIDKPPSTLASEVVNYLLDGLAGNNPDKTLLEVYKKWLDSKSCQKSFEGYLKKYKLAAKSDVFAIHPSHPFVEIDDSWLEELGKNISDKGFIAGFILKINQRIVNKTAQNLGINFWIHVKTLLEFDEKNINQLASFDECVSFYTRHFYKLDRAIRILYSQYLNNEKLLQPIQNYYKNLVIIFLDKWFRFNDKYQSDQSGTIQKIIDDNEQKTAIIIGDGISYEFAQDIIESVSKEYKLSLDFQYMFAGLPSETEHNMSQLYLTSGDVVSTKKERESFIAVNNSYKDVGFKELETVNEMTDSTNYLICSHKDPDKLGETYQQKALKYFNEVAELYARKIELLLRNGYQNVYLLTDHGYVLTGLLDNSDKIEVDFTGKVEKNERFIRTENGQTIDKNLLIEKKIKYKEYNYCYFAKRLGPFKTPGVYGYSHGGLSPQETIIPFLRWSHTLSKIEALEVLISNKIDLKEVTGDLYAIKLKARSTTHDLFTTERKIVLLFFVDNKKSNGSEVITIERDKEIKKEYCFGSQTTIELKIIDAVTKEQLDKATINQSSARDIGNLL